MLTAIKPGKSFVDMSSVEVETSVELHEVCLIEDWNFNIITPLF